MEYNLEDIYNLLSDISDDLNCLKENQALSVCTRTDKQKWENELYEIRKLIVHHDGNKDQILKELEEKYEMRALKSISYFDHFLMIQKGVDTAENLKKVLLEEADVEIDRFNDSTTKRWIKTEGGRPEGSSLGLDRNFKRAKNYIDFVFENNGDLIEVENYIEIVSSVSIHNEKLREIMGRVDWDIKEN